MKLTGEVSETVIRQNLQYYSDYIDTAIRGGRSEEEVLRELGSPVLIARTIIDTGAGTENQTYSADSHEERDVAREDSRGFHVTLDEKMAKWIFLAVVVLVVILLLTILRLLLPVAVPVLLILAAIKLLKKK